MSNENELLEPLATEAGQQAIARAINNLSSLEYAVRAERAATTATQKADEASNSANDASDYATEARNWATKTDGYVAQETITTPPEQEGDEPTTETIDLYSARYYAAQAQDIYNNLQFDSVPTENSTNLISSGAVYTALNGKADKSDTYTKTEVDTALSNVQSTLTFDNVPTANSDNPVKSSGIKTALDGKQDNLTFDSTPTANSTNPVTSGGVYTALQNVNIDIDDEITEDSDNPVTSAAIYEALQNFTPSGGGSGGAGNASGITRELLYSNTSGVNSGIITLSKSWEEFDFILYGVAVPSEYSQWKVLNYMLDVPKTKVDDNSSTRLIFSRNDGSSTRYITVSYQTGTTINISSQQNLYLYFVYGIKFSKNLSEQMYSNVLYENASGINSGTFTLTDDWNNYDFVSFEIWNGSSGSKNQHLFAKEFLENCYTNAKDLIVIRYTTSQVTLHPTTNYKTFSINNSTDNGKIYKVVGYKLAKGGYSGIVSDARMTVKSGVVELSDVLATYGNSDESVIFDSPMPDTNYVVSVSREFGGTGWVAVEYKISNKTVNGFTLTINNQYNYATSEKPKFSWIAIRPNSYTREGMVEDILFSNASGVSSGTINLSGNISDYDLIEIYRFANDNKELYSSIVSSSDLLQRNSDLLRYVVVGDGNNYTEIYCPTDSSVVIRSISGEKITKITGIKFGRYVSGVAVDTIVTQNSNAVVTSGAVYDALQNAGGGGGGGGTTYTAGDGIDITNDEISLETASANSIGGIKVGTGLSIDTNGVLSASGGSGNSVYTLKTESYRTIFSCDNQYYVAASGRLYQHSGRTYYKYNALPAICCMFLTPSGDTPRAMLVSLEADATITSGSYYEYRTTRYNPGTVTYLGKTWYYATTSYPYSGLDYTADVPLLQSSLLSGQYTLSDVALALLQESNAYLADQEIEEDLFSPTNFTLSSGGTISDNILQSLVAGNRPIKVNGETYYPIKLDNGTYYYEGQTNTITIDSSWVITIIAKSSGGGSSITVDSTITQGGTNPVEGGAIYTALGDKADKSTTYTKTEVDTAVASKGDVTTNTDQNITGTKTFVGSKKVGFKQSAANDKLGFTLYGNTGTERGYLEFNPQNTIDGVAGLMTLGNYATSAAGLTQVGFRRYSNISGASGAYNLLMPMIADARTPFSLTTSYQNFYLPLGFTDGTTTVKTAKSGVVDLSPLLASLEARIAALEGN